MSRHVKSVLLWLAGIAAAIGLWELAYRLHLVNPLIVGAPSLIVRAAVQHGGSFIHACSVTASEIAIAIAVSWTVGIGLGAVLGSVRLLGGIFSPILSGLIAVPFVVIYPLLIAWVGIGPQSKIVFAILMGIFPIMLGTLIGVRSADRSFARMASAFGAGHFQVLTQVMMPLALPTILSGLRIGTSLIIIGVVLGEMLGANAGLGYLIAFNQNMFDTGAVYLGILLAVAIAVVIDRGLSAVEHHFGRWKGDASTQG